MQGLTIGYLSYGTAALAYLVLAGFYLWRGRWGSHGPFFLTAVAATVLWALVAFSGHDVIPRFAAWTLLLKQFAMLAWAWFLWHFIASLEPYKARFPQRLLLGWIFISLLSVTTLVILGVNLLLGLPWVNLGFFGFNSALLPLLMGLAIALFGLSLTETLYRGYRSAERWGVKYLCLATGGLFAYDIFLYGEGLIFRAIDPAFMDIRGLAQALVVPFLIINIRRSQVRHFALGLSQRLVFGSTVVFGAGIYLVIMAVAAFYVRIMGGAWGSAVQIIFLFAALLLLVTFLMSGSFRAQVRYFLSHHVLADKYDYRGEWLRFSGRLAAAESDESFERRVIRALADIVDSPAGALWSVGDNHLPIAAAWNLSPTSLSAVEMASVEDYLKSRDQVLDLADDEDDIADAPEACARLLEALKAIPDAWVLIPLLHQDRLVALLLLTRSRSPRDLTPEDGELLAAAARQAAGLLAEQRLARDLAEARQFERFNQRYAFVAHDLKNLVSQLSLMVKNHERFGERPEFQEDMIETIKSAVARMENVMARLSGGNLGARENEAGKSETGPAKGKNGAEPEAGLVPLLQRLVTKYEDSVDTLDLSLSGQSAQCGPRTDCARIETMLNHLLQNAIEAAGAHGRITVTLRDQDHQMVIEVRDNGPGMEARFIEEELFKPFRSTKSGGFGIGAYQCRVLARELGGELEAISAPGAGTTMRLILPREPAEKTVSRA
ncbi:XrtA/PEP-CTERM system histidine kinase PrsK [Pelagibius sp.]|uniref:XrtA/PEP-CTERM system histidine kinase PrsK n=1 Tax=Pelagibius sp. TaxID=1931238 RepID=UPI002605C135|nr:XrtA/PEP-CTERM system histidine kinase PrsK [Pelagibius sp.]